MLDLFLLLLRFYHVNSMVHRFSLAGDFASLANLYSKNNLNSCISSIECMIHEFDAEIMIIIKLLRLDQAFEISHESVLERYEKSFDLCRCKSILCMCVWVMSNYMYMSSFEKHRYTFSKHSQRIEFGLW